MHIHLYLYLYVYIYIIPTSLSLSLCFLHSFGGSLRSAEVESACKDLEKPDCVKDLRAVLATNEAEGSLCCFILELVVSLPRKTKEVQKPEFKRKETSKILPSTLLQVCLWLGVMSRQHSLLQTRQHSLLQTMLVPKKRCLHKKFPIYFASGGSTCSPRLASSCQLELCGVQPVGRWHPN